MRRRNQQRTLLTRLLAATLLVGALLSFVFSNGQASAQDSTEDNTEDSPDSTGNAEELTDCPADRTTVPVADSAIRIVKVAGLIDPAVRGNLMSKLEAAEADPDVFALIIWTNSQGSVLNEDEYLEMATALHESPLQIGLWVGQPGSTAQGGAAELATVADIVGVTPNSTIGNTGPRRLPAEWGTPFGDATERLETALFDAEESIQAGISIGPSQDTVPVGSFALNLDGFESLRCLDESGSIETIPQSQAQLSGLSLPAQMFHSVASPEVAYLFFALGLSLLVFELFTAGIGVAGLTGVGFLALGCYGLAVLPTRWWAIGLLLLGIFFMAIDIQTNIPRHYTVAGLVCFTVGTLTLYEGVSMSWLTIGVGLIGAALYAYTGMPSMVRTRFSTPTIGRKWMIGSMGEATTEVAPEGTVKIRDATWRAITNRATPIKQGEAVRVVGIDRLILEVEPEEGAAVDYRERRS